MKKQTSGSSLHEEQLHVMIDHFFHQQFSIFWITWRLRSHVTVKSLSGTELVIFKHLWYLAYYLDKKVLWNYEIMASFVLNLVESDMDGPYQVWVFYQKSISFKVPHRPIQGIKTHFFFRGKLVEPRFAIEVWLIRH